MRLLVVTQAVDSMDPALGFFVRWIEELSKRAESVEVICLKKGTYSLPNNARVYSLGKEKCVSRIKYILNFYTYVWRLRLNYDSVFVHMNEEYVFLGGIFWRIFGKKIILWRNHKMDSWLTRLTVALSNSVCYTSPDAFVARYKNAVAMPVGVDTDFFVPPASPAPESTILFFGRLDPVKRAEIFIEALANVLIPFRADIYGSPTDANLHYAQHVVAQAQPLVTKGALALYPGISHERVRRIYQSHAIYVNLTPSGSFDKTIGEAMASGCIVVASNAVLRGVVRPECMVRDGDAKDVARGISVALSISARERIEEARKLRAYIEKNHSLKKLIDKLINEL